ncbi:5-formyltetrahydrofolate cyclo-ligase [Sediminihabitans luteus]|uniref:5-formyltetrahydrofolate cyclo-ligase n=1 Tax=Sediminihabitans luteus TaxID=1138585 RepID=A0A2M9CDW1_9CELL|nr:5-formyltetrahydrofolate cyclo-ligase [Sediminihabitans luteus]PJJ70126.1 5-formyltetrahydrofolate cyclo-ligase [Sediminihabitans luteus]GIJ00573.1 5-formyltetrahydrofolate cyclo-ligase [Sediminihabitans luteus]
MSGSTQPHPSPNLEAEDAKDALRKAIRTARSERSERLRAEASAAIADVVDTVPEVALARCVASYAARSHEPGTGVVHDRLALRGARVLLPVLGAGLQRDWAVYAGPDDLQVRAPGRPPEPGTPTLPPETLVEADVVLAPALAVDTRGVRLGQGGGWYDRALQHVRPGVTVVAVVYPEELYDADLHPLPFEAHDRRVDAVVTPHGWHRLTRD